MSMLGDEGEWGSVIRGVRGSDGEGGVSDEVTLQQDRPVPSGELCLMSYRGGT